MWLPMRSLPIARYVPFLLVLAIGAACGLDPRPKIEMLVTHIDPLRLSPQPDEVEVALCDKSARAESGVADEGRWFAEIPCGSCPLSVRTRTAGVERVYTSLEPFAYCGSQSGFTVWSTVTLEDNGVAAVEFNP